MQISSDRLNGRLKNMETIRANQDQHALASTGLYLTGYSLHKAEIAQKRHKAKGEDKLKYGSTVVTLNTPYNVSSGGNIASSGQVSSTNGVVSNFAVVSGASALNGGVVVGGTTVVNSSGQVPAAVVNGTVASAASVPGSGITGSISGSAITGAISCASIHTSGQGQFDGGITGSFIVTSGIGEFDGGIQVGGTTIANSSAQIAGSAITGAISCSSIHTSGTGQFDGAIAGCITINSSGAITNSASIHCTGLGQFDSGVKLSGGTIGSCHAFGDSDPGSGATAAQCRTYMVDLSNALKATGIIF